MREVLKVKEWLKNKKHLLLVSNPKGMVLCGILKKFEIENKNPCHPYKHETYLK